jgi:uncharacterized protein
VDSCMRECRDCIILFLREPRFGRVKTRLSRHLEETLVLDLYRAFVLDTLETLGACHEKTLIFVEPSSATDSVARWLGDRFTYIGQKGKDLGERMGNAFTYAFSQGFQHAVLVGSDAPDLPQTLIDQSFDRLRENQAIIGPSGDGGYYLIGFSTQHIPTEVFTLPAWGTDSVFSVTASVLSKSNCTFEVLPKWADVDELPDLRRFLSGEGVVDSPYGGRTRTLVREYRTTIESALARLDGGRGT